MSSSWIVYESPTDRPYELAKLISLPTVRYISRRVTVRLYASSLAHQDRRLDQMNKAKPYLPYHQT
jgi:hypothetical protein